MSDEAPEVPASVRERLTLLTVDQVCDLLQVNRDWLYDLCRKGQFPHVKIGRAVRFRPAEVEAYIEGTWRAVS